MTTNDEIINFMISNFSYSLILNQNDYTFIEFFKSISDDMNNKYTHEQVTEAFKTIGVKI